MRTTVTLDDKLLADAEFYTGIREKSALIREALFGRGIGYVDAHLLAAARLTAGTKLWTHDRRLQAVAAQLGLAAVLSH